MSKKKAGPHTVQMRFAPEVIKMVEELKSLTGITNRTHLVRCAIDVFHTIAKVQAEGGKVQIVQADGTKESVLFIY